MFDVLFKECLLGEREFEYVLFGDICEDFDEDIL